MVIFIIGETMKNKKGTNTILTYLLLTFIIICSIFKYKTVFLEPNNVLEVSISNLLYPFTFLFTILILKKSNFKETHKIIIKTALVFLIFTVILSIMNSIPGSYYTREADLALKNVLTPHYFMIGTTPIYYPDILSTLSFTILFYFSHILVVILYEAMEPYTYKFVAFALAMFIPFALDTICYTTIVSTFENVEFSKLITNLTSNFVLVIIYSIFITLLYLLFTRKKVRSNH